ncbi:MAG: M48 family metallopeptidase [Nitrospirae bacterium]|nr:MAG: M48 family metallopeptidase [Nitrospirota bacterium]
MNDSPNALCFGSNLPAAGAPCRVEVSSAGLRVELPDLPAEAISFTGLSVTAGGFDQDQLVVKWTHGGVERTAYLKDPAVITAFRQAAPPDLMPHLERTAAHVRRARSGRRTLLAVAVGSVIGLLLILWLGSDALVRMAVTHIPVEWERSIGDATRGQFLAGQQVVKEGPAVAAVQEITQRLAEQIPNNPYTFEVTVVRSDVVNAFALPGGYVIVFTGLLKKADSPDEVAGVLSHELNHVVLRHGLERIVKTLGIVAVVTIFVGNQEGLVGLAKQLGIELATLKFGREQEMEADLQGLRLLHRAKIASDGMIHFFERLSESDKLQVELLSTHPMSAARAERLKAAAATLPKQEPVPFGFEWKAVQAGL